MANTSTFEGNAQIDNKKNNGNIKGMERVDVITHKSSTDFAGSSDDVIEMTIFGRVTGKKVNALAYMRSQAHLLLKLDSHYFFDIMKLENKSWLFQISTTPLDGSYLTDLVSKAKAHKKNKTDMHSFIYRLVVNDSVSVYVDSHIFPEDGRKLNCMLVHADEAHHYSSTIQREKVIDLIPDTKRKLTAINTPSITSYHLSTLVFGLSLIIFVASLGYSVMASYKEVSKNLMVLEQKQLIKIEVESNMAKNTLSPISTLHKIIGMDDKRWRQINYNPITHNWSATHVD
ncbi:hypothetical protein V6259_12555 [Marinomonas sp. TI.3.20]|uniref:hypothetical protein n=1 Tax=Marinomonas sp. TI.3.20 TaxID=3121296 RepID=UPI00311F2815